MRTESGERWTMTHGRCEEWLLTLEPESVDALIYDPPYGSGGRRTTDRVSAAPNGKYLNGTREYAEFDGETRDQLGWIDWMTWVLMRSERVMKFGAVFAIFVDHRQIVALMAAIQRSGLIYRGNIPWDKTEGCRPNRGYPSQQCEFVLWGSKGATAKDRMCGTESGSMSGCFRYPVKAADKSHPVGKPTALMHDIVKICNRGGLIIDAFAGSCTTGVAAVANGYRFAGCESTAAYFEESCRRLRDASADFRADSGMQLSLDSARGPS